MSELSVKNNIINTIQKEETIDSKGINYNLIKNCLMRIKSEKNNIIDDNIINLEEEENNKEEEEIEEENNGEEEEDEEYSKSNSMSGSNSDIEKKNSKLKLINKYRRHYDTESAFKKKVASYKKSNKRTILKRKKYYVYQLLKRWWYALPPWPPENIDVSEKLKQNKLRLIEEKNWKKEVEINSDDFKKCIELPGYKYVYITKEGKVYDFRPEEGKPSFNNLMKLDDIELHQYLVNALKKQLEELEKRNNINEFKLIKQISNQLKIEKLNLKHIQNTQNT
jgi:hypothetical protein